MEGEWKEKVDDEEEKVDDGEEGGDEEEEKDDDVDLARVSMLTTALTEVAKLERSLGCDVKIR